MSASTVITLGFGSFGGSQFLPTLGYSTSGLPPPIPAATPPVVGGSGKERRNEIIEIEGKRFVVPKTQVAEFLDKYGPQPAPVVDIPTPPSITPSLQTVSFTTPKGKTVTVDRQVVTDDIGVILVMCALADEDFYE